MKGLAPNRPSKMRWARVDALTDATIDTSDVPPLADAFFERAQWRMPLPCIAVTLHVDPEVVAWFKAQGEG